MRSIGLFSILVSLALVAVAAVGSVPSSAVTLCMVEGNPSKTCPEGKGYLAREYKAKLATGQSAIFQGEGERLVTCGTSTVAAETTQASAAPLPGILTSLTFAGCTGCTAAKPLNLSYNLAITSIGDNRKDGDLKVTKLGGPPQIEFTQCFGLAATCKYGAASEKVDLEIKGGNPAKIVASLEQFQYVGGTSEVACGKTGTFTATYELTEPTAVWVTSAP